MEVQCQMPSNFWRNRNSNFQNLDPKILRSNTRRTLNILKQIKLSTTEMKEVTTDVTFNIDLNIYIYIYIFIDLNIC